MPMVKVCSVEEVPDGEMRRYELDGLRVAVANCGDDGFRAIDAICSHAHYFLDEGELDCDLATVECPKHGSTFDLETGKARTLPATLSVAIYPVKIENDNVWIEVQP